MNENYVERWLDLEGESARGAICPETTSAF